MSLIILLDSIIDADSRRSAESAMREEAARLLSNCQPKCGICVRWMRSDCVPEKQQGQFRTASSSACPIFKEMEYISHWRYRAEKINSQLQASA